MKNIKKNDVKHVSFQMFNFWYILKEYRLRENDIIKLGRIKFRVKELKSSKNILSRQNDTQIEENYEFVNFINILSKILSNQIIVVVLKKISQNNI